MLAALRPDLVRKRLVVRRDDLILLGLGVVMMTQDGLEEMEPKREGGGEGEEYQEDDEAPEDLYLVDGGRAQVEQDAPQVDEKHRLPLVVSSLDEAVVDMALVRLSDAHVRAHAADDGGEGVDDGHARHDERDDERGERRGARYVEQRDGAQSEAKQQRSGIAKEDLGGVEIVAKEGDARADKRGGDGGGVATSR